MNVKITFLNGDLDEEIYMDQPEGFLANDKEHIVCKLKKSIDRLKHVSRQWYIKFNDIITNFKLKENIIVWCIYLKISGNKFIFLILDGDDILHATNDFGLSYETKKFHSNNCEMNDMGKTSYVIVIEIFLNLVQILLRLS